MVEDNPATPPVIVWFRRDLRLNDHAPLRAAVETGAPIIPLYIYDLLTPDCTPPGAASRWWLHKSLSALREDLASFNQTLTLRQGPSGDVIEELLRETGAKAIYFHHIHQAGEAALEQDIAKIAKEQGADCHRFQGELLFSPAQIKTGSGGPYKVFTPFWRACLEEAPPKKPLLLPDAINAADAFPASEELESWGLLPTRPNWARSFESHWQPGEKGAQKALTSFLEGGVADYQKQRDYPAEHGTSRLSPHLHFGEVSVRQVWHKANGKEGGEAFLREIGWREFCHHLLHHWPELDRQPFRPAFKAFPWRENKGRENKAHIKAWQKGQTGYPIIDAGLRELWQTGWMHNRVRMIVASFLTKNLMQHWHVGADWFWETLVDADLANNAAGWQWVAGSGADAAPYFRIFNPVTQSEKFDNKGDYIRTYVPELAKLPDKYIHNPSSAPADVLETAGVVLGKTYPRAIVDLKESRTTALAAYQAMKEKEDEQE